jgi:hypothetical protein
MSLSSQKYGFVIRDPEKNLFRIPDPGVKKAPDPGSGSATLILWEPLIFIETVAYSVSNVLRKLASSKVTDAKMYLPTTSMVQQNL